MKKILCCYLLSVIMLAGCKDEEKEHVEEDKLPVSGEWIVTTGFGSFSFIVNPQGTHISNISLTFSDFACGGISRSGTISSTNEAGWPINLKKFSITITIDPFRNDKMSVEGQFNQKGNSASGTWQAVVSGTTCPGSWGPVNAP